MNPGLHLIWGDDDFALGQEEARLTREVVDPAWGAMNLNVLDAAAPASTAIAAAMTMPFGPGGRLVVVRDCPYFKPRKKADGGEEAAAADEAESEDAKALLSLFERGLPGGCHLLFVVRGAVDKRTGVAKQALQSCRCQEFAVPRSKPWEEGPAPELVRWVEERARERGARCSHEAAQELVVRVGADRLQLDQELAKLATYAADAPVDTAIVRLLSPSGEGDVFALAQAICRRQVAQAVVLLNRLLDVEPALKLLATLGSSFRRYLATARYRDLGMSADAIVRATGGKPFTIKRDLETARQWRVEQLERALEHFVEADLTLKTRSSGKAQERIVLEVLIAKLATT